MRSPYVREQRGFFDVGPAAAPAAIDMGGGIWMSPGMSNTYLVVGEGERMVVNTGMWFESKVHKRNFDAVSSDPTRYIVLTQSHTDHIGGVDMFREAGTELVTQANNAACQDDDERIHGFRIRRSLPFFASVMGRPGYVRGDDVEIPPTPKVAVPDVVFDDSIALSVGGRPFELLSVPGGETIDSLVVWLPKERVALVGNMFSALFGHMPNLVTMRGDRLRFALPFVASVQRVIDLEPETLLLGHHGPVRRSARVREELVRIRDAVRWVHDATVDAMNRGEDVWTAMRDIRLPDDLELGDDYGRVGWSVRAIWEGYAGWFHQHSTLELYPATPEHGWAEIVALAGGADVVAERAATAEDPLTAVRLCEMALAVDGEHPGALRAYVDAHERLMVAHRASSGGSPNFWLTRWLEGEIGSARNRLARIESRAE